MPFNSQLNHGSDLQNQVGEGIGLTLVMIIDAYAKPQMPITVRVENLRDSLRGLRDVQLHVVALDLNHSLISSLQ